MLIKRHKTIVALGADINSRFCILKGKDLILSREFGDLSDLDNFNNFKNALLESKSKPHVVSFDMHPGYFSSQAKDLFKTGEKIAVQHHHAHIASMLFNRSAECAKLKRPVIGVAFDGTGYGMDGHIWGGEFLLVDNAGFKRIGHFKYLKMPGGEFAVKEPWRMAFSLIHDYLYYDMFDLHLECLQLKSEYFYTTLYGMLSQGINCPLTSSVGRLFDAVSSILGLCHEISFPAEAAVKLEKLATPSKESGFYEFDILEEDNCFVISYSKFLRGLLYDIDRGIPGEDIAKKFHNSLVEIIIKMIDKISSAHNTKDIVLSGGVFQNKILFAAAAKRLSEGGYNLIYDKQTPVNDLGICLGQIYVAKTCA